MPEIPLLTVSQLTREIKDLLENQFPAVNLQGEISNCKRASSGHVYLSLKDEHAQISAVIWKNTASRLKFELQDGLEVIAAGRVEVYQPRGSMQVIIEQLIPQGMGELELAFRQLCEKLEKEGLFDDERKKPLPEYPRKIALITSPTSAAVRDLLQVIARRWKAVDLLVLPVAVQGDDAPRQIVEAFRQVERIPGVDVVVTGRGGGSLEDLWAFNTEIVARAIVACSLPTISAVGHEVDVSISDLVADRRALTPSEAAEFVVPDKREVAAVLQGLSARMNKSLFGRAERARMLLETLSSRRVFSHPLDQLNDRFVRLDEFSSTLAKTIRRRFEIANSTMEKAGSTLEALSPLKVLKRGYSITENSKTGKPIRDIDDVQEGRTVRTKLSAGSFLSQVTSIEGKNESCRYT